MALTNYQSTVLLAARGFAGSLRIHARSAERGKRDKANEIANEMFSWADDIEEAISRVRSEFLWPEQSSKI